MLQDLINFFLYMQLYGSNLGLDLDYTALTVSYFIVYALIAAGAFLLKGFGLYKLSMINGVDRPYLSFIPFVSFYQLGRLIGPMSVFRVRVKNLGLIVGILTFAIGVIYNVTSFFRYFESLQTILNANSLIPVKTADGSIRADYYVLNEIAFYLCRFADIANIILTVFLYITFFRLYTKQSYFLYSILSILIDPLFSVFVFILRNNKKGDFYRRVYIDPQDFYRKGQNGQYGGNSRSNDFTARRNDDPFNEYRPKTDGGSVFEEYPDNDADQNVYSADRGVKNNQTYKKTDNDQENNDDLF